MTYFKFLQKLHHIHDLIKNVDLVIVSKIACFDKPIKSHAYGFMKHIAAYVSPALVMVIF